MSRGDWTRRRALAGMSGAGVLAATVRSGALSRTTTASAARSAVVAQSLGLQHFVSRPDLIPPAISVRPAADAPADPPYFFLTARPSRRGPGGAMILDRQGDLVWFSPDAPSQETFNLAPQTYCGQPVLTWWQGTVTGGHGAGSLIIADASYQAQHIIGAQRGLAADLHDFVITADNTALITAYRSATADLTSIGGSAGGTVLSGVVQEIDIATGRLLFEWDSLHHVGVAETCQALAGGTAAEPFDYFHLNSVQALPGGDLLVSARDTWTIYRIARPGGAVRWRLGGKKSDFAMGTGAQFYWQHMARLHPGGILSLFDDGAAPAEEPQSRGLILDVSTSSMQASVRQQYAHPQQTLLATSMGSTQILADGRVVVGWGTEPYFSEFAADGGLLLDGEIAAGSLSYRAIRGSWAGRPGSAAGGPDSAPAVAARRGSSGTTVYASWNGATAVRSWRLLAGMSPAALADAGSVRRDGFETSAVVPHRGPYFAAEAQDHQGHVLGQSATIRAT